MPPATPSRALRAARIRVQVWLATLRAGALFTNADIRAAVPRILNMRLVLSGLIRTGEIVVVEPGAVGRGNGPLYRKGRIAK